MNALTQARWFLLVGSLTTMTGLGLIYGLRLAGLGPLTANFVGYAVAIPLSYVAHATISFRGQKIRLASFSKYIIAILVSYLSNLVILITLIKIFVVNSYLAQIPAFGAYGVAFFLLNRWFVFSEKHPFLAATVPIDASE